jgi:adenine-specific DNA-methyltransferase
VASVTVADRHVQNFGEVFTRRWVADVLLDLTDYTPERDLGSLRLLEPSSGSGAFLGPAVDRLIASANARGRELDSLSDAIRAYDLQPEHVAASRALCRRLLAGAGLPDEIATNLAETWIQCADFLLPSEVEARAYDIAIGNPPYIRYDDLPSNLVAEYRSLEGEHFRGQSSKRNDCLRGENRLWVRRAGSSPLSLRPRL